jgi:hypothetical protein
MKKSCTNNILFSFMKNYKLININFYFIYLNCLFVLFNIGFFIFYIKLLCIEMKKKENIFKFRN